jgi:hypothetical protein
MPLTNYEKRVALKIAELVARDGATEGLRVAYKELEDAITALSPDAQMHWYKQHYLPNKLQKEVNGTEEERRAMTALLEEAKSKGGK